MRALSLALIASLFLVACGGSGGDTASSEAASDAASDPSTGTATASQTVDRTVTLTPVGNQMKYEQTEFTVAPGETVKLVFDNVATAPSMQHNVVLLTEPPSRDAFQRIGEGGMEAGAANDYVPDDDAVLAYTPMSKPGETVEVVFTVPDDPGEYGYVCTFPGHWATMNGTMRVTSAAA